MQSYIHLSKYSRWMDIGRRENWNETIDRTALFWHTKFPEMGDMIDTSIESMRSLESVGSMRSLMTAGPALDRDNAAGYNCAAIALTDQRAFDEIFYLLMCGCGVGFSVERQYICQLPIVPVVSLQHKQGVYIHVRDSKIGWAESLKELIATLYRGDTPTWNTDDVRPAGARLKTFGGRASGPEPLEKLFKYIVRVFKKAEGRKLNSIECHDIICKIADTVIVGSVRRSACISLSNLTDARMARAKQGEWYLTEPQRMLANNSVAYTEKPDLSAYTEEMRNLYTSKAGERGIVNKVALKQKAIETGRVHSGDYLLNPCGEAILRDTGGFCNLSEVIIRPDDSLETLSKKIASATVFGTLQATLCDFRYVRDVWKQNQEEERLLGVSLTGIMDHPLMNGRQGMPALVETLEVLKKVAHDTNKEVAAKLGIPASKHVTLIKPSGTVSQLCGTSSGIHPRYAEYYLRRVTQDSKDPLTDLMISQGIPYVVTGEKTIFSFPIKSPEGAVCARDMGAIEQLELWKVYREYWCDGNPSQTIYYTDSDFLEMQAWVYKNWDIIGGLSFFPIDDFVYDEATQPYLEIDKERYEKEYAMFPAEVHWEKLSDFEKEDGTTSHQTLACQGGACEL